MHCFKNQKYKLLKSAMICLLMGAAFVSTDGVLSAAFAGEQIESETEESPVARVQAIELEIKKKHGDWVYAPMVYNTTESTKETRNFGRVLHEINSKLKITEDVNGFLEALGGLDPSGFINKAYSIIDFYFKDAVDKISTSETELLFYIAQDFYAMSSFMDIAIAGLSYKKAIEYMAAKDKVEFELAKETQTKVMQGALQEKDLAVSSATVTFEKTKKEAEESHNQVISSKESTINGLKQSNERMMQGSKIPPKKVSENEMIIKKLSSEILSAKAELELKIKEITKIRDEAIKLAEKNFSTIKLKQDDELRLAEEKLKSGTAGLKESFSWFVEGIGGGYGTKTISRAYNRKPQDRGYYNYHVFNTILEKHPKIKENARLDFVSKFVSQKAPSEMYHLLGISDEDLEKLQLRTEKDQKRLMNSLVSVSKTEKKSTTQKKSSK